MTALAAYFDDSQQGGVFVLAGYVAPLDVFDNGLAPDWWQVLSKAPHPLTEFKASDCRSRLQEFAGWEPEETLSLTTDLVSLLCDTERYPSLFGVATALAFPYVKPQTQNLFKRAAYTLCFTEVVAGALTMGSEILGADSMRFVFDRQKGLEGKANELFDMAIAVLEYKRGEKIPVDPLAFEESHKLAPLQAADLLAHETAKELVNRPMGKVPSKALSRLLEARPHFARYYDLEKIRELVGRLERKDFSDAMVVPLIYDLSGLKR